MLQQVAAGATCRLMERLAVAQEGRVAALVRAEHYSLLHLPGPLGGPKGLRRGC
jgi:hypothetical protein